MKIIFLDIDGVIATSQCWGRGNENKWDSYMFDPKCVAVLNFILKETGADIVLSSDWKSHYSLFEMNEIFTHNGVIKGPICFTPSSKTYTGDNLEGGRCDEILGWLKHHGTSTKVSQNTREYDIKWVAIDDLDMSEKFDDISGNYVTGLKNFVHCTKHMEGIKQCGIKEKILKFLE
jgi:hypothetical protein